MQCVHQSTALCGGDAPILLSNLCGEQVYSQVGNKIKHKGHSLVGLRQQNYLVRFYEKITLHLWKMNTCCPLTYRFRSNATQAPQTV